MSDPMIPGWAQWGRLQQIRQALPEEVQPPPLRSCERLGLVCESLQVTGSYKVRAVCHLLSLHRDRLPPGGLALASSGNFAVALAWAGSRFGVPVTAVMMRRSHPWKVERVRAFGGRVVFCEDSTEERTATLLQLRDQGILVVDHLVDPEVLAGHATLGVDLSQARPSQVIVPASTGGLLAATAVAVKQACPDARIVGVQPQGANALVRSLRSGRVQRLERVETECDALTANRPGDLPFQLSLEWVDEMVEVSEESIREAVRWAVERAKLVVEPGGAAGLAAVRSGQVENTTGTWIVLSGGNISPARLSDWLRTD